MESITIVTFISKGENLNTEFVDLVDFLRSSMEVMAFIFADVEIDVPAHIKLIVSPQTTKYYRIKSILNSMHYKFILFIDNDIVPDKVAILRLLRQCKNNSFSLAWGKIRAQHVAGIISKIVDVEKRLSHNYIRPLLWELHIGISLPGQVFIMDSTYFYKILPDIDTVYDDLMIGVTARKYDYPVFYVKDILGYEFPKTTLLQLICQRIRWAKGLAETMFYHRFEHSLVYIILHAFYFNLLWIPVYSLIAYLATIHYFVAAIMLVLALVFLADCRPQQMSSSILYMLIFPAIYAVWFLSVIINLFRLCMADKCGGN